MAGCWRGQAFNAFKHSLFPVYPHLLSPFPSLTLPFTSRHSHRYDWGPTIITQGIPRSVYIVGAQDVLLKDAVALTYPATRDGKTNKETAKETSLETFKVTDTTEAAEAVEAAGAAETTEMTETADDPATDFTLKVKVRLHLVEKTSGVMLSVKCTDCNDCDFGGRDGDARGSTGGENEGGATQMTGALPAGESIVDMSLDVRNASLWWPNGYGAQPLYNLQITASIVPHMGASFSSPSSPTISPSSSVAPSGTASLSSSPPSSTPSVTSFTTSVYTSRRIAFRSVALLSRNATNTTRSATEGAEQAYVLLTAFPLD